MQNFSQKYFSSVVEYRHSFQGQEKDDEIKGEGNSVNYKYRMHDTRVGRFFAVDPLEHVYPYYSPYVFSGNRVIDALEYEGKEPVLLITYFVADYIADSYGYNVNLEFKASIGAQVGFEIGDLGVDLNGGSVELLEIDATVAGDENITFDYILKDQQYEISFGATLGLIIVSAEYNYIEVYQKNSDGTRTLITEGDASTFSSTVYFYKTTTPPLPHESFLKSACQLIIKAVKLYLFRFYSFGVFT